MRTLLIILAIILVALGLYLVLDTDRNEVVAEPTSFEECAALYPIMESDPRRCVTPNGVQFIEETVTTAPDQNTGDTPQEAGIPNLITVDSPDPGDQVSSPLTITGEARGTWYFEASFPIEIRNSAGTVIAQTPGEAQGEWMTENFVPFRATLSFPSQPAGSQGTVVLHKSNASGLPENDQSVTIPIVF